MNLRKLIPAVAGVLASGVSFSHASPSGLNNIPTADTAPQGTVVLQAWSTVGGGRDEDFNLGFKSGIDLGPVKAEFGLDSHILPDDEGPLTFQAKLAVPFGENLPTIAAGVANTTFAGSDADRAGEPFGYLVLTHDFGFLRGHAGCGLQEGDALPFFGLDKTLRIRTSSGGAAAPAPVAATGKQPVGGKYPVAAAAATATATGAADGTRDLFTLRADGIQQHDSSWLYSAGVLVPLGKYVVFETWGNFPDGGDDASLTLKLNLVLSF